VVAEGSSARGLPTRIVKVVYSEKSFNEGENSRGGGNLIHYLYFYEPDPADDARFRAACRPGSKVYIYDCKHMLVDELTVVAPQVRPWK
jgi:hypothetical protein